MRFIVDQMLGRLAKYMRFLGYDTYFPDRFTSDDKIIEIAKKDERIIITRDKELAIRFNDSLYVDSKDVYEQLKIVIKHFSLSMDNILTRCSICNAVLSSIDKENVKKKVPDYVFKSQEKFFYCSSCNKVYWYGTHTKNILKIIKEAV